MMKEIKRYMDGYSYIKFHDKSKVQNQQGISNSKKISQNHVYWHSTYSIKYPIWHLFSQPSL